MLLKHLIASDPCSASAVKTSLPPAQRRSEHICFASKSVIGNIERDIHVQRDGHQLEQLLGQITTSIIPNNPTNATGSLKLLEQNPALLSLYSASPDSCLYLFLPRTNADFFHTSCLEWLECTIFVLSAVGMGIIFYFFF